MHLEAPAALLAHCVMLELLTLVTKMQAVCAYDYKQRDPLKAASMVLFVCGLKKKGQVQTMDLLIVSMSTFEAVELAARCMLFIVCCLRTNVLFSLVVLRRVSRDYWLCVLYKLEVKVQIVHL